MNRPFEQDPEAMNPPDPEDDIVELVDEDGNSTFFEHLATLEYQGGSYLLLCDPEAPEDDIEVIVMKIEQDENGDDFYAPPDDETADRVFNYFLSQMEDAEE